jgi:hypothetical protein
MAIATNSSSKIPNPACEFLLLRMIVLTGSGKENRHREDTPNVGQYGDSL